MSIEIDFEMHVDSKGYRLDHGRIVGNGGAPITKRLKALPRPLYQELLKVGTPEELRDFANLYGQLTQNRVQGKKIIKGDDVSEVLSKIDTMRSVLKILKEARVQPGNLPRWEGGPFEYVVDTPERKIKMSGGIPLPATVAGKLRAWLVPNAAGELEFQLHPPSLLDALWLQFGQALVSKAELRSCEQCGRWFQAGAGGVRIDAKFCSPGCRRKYNSLKRSR
jgi:hypothetical protein